MTKNLRNISLVISYDGSSYVGWQKQSKDKTNKTLQEELEKALEKLHGNKIEIIGAGRTDSGVHARGQVANFFSDIESIPVKNFIPALNSILPKSIRIIDAREEDKNFHSRFCAVKRTYRYFLYCGESPLANEMPYIWHINYWPKLKNLNDMANYLCGEIDFTSFTTVGDKSPSKFRYIYNSNFFYNDKTLVYEITANAFLWKMIRSLVGTFIDLEKKDKNPSCFKTILDSKNRKLAGTTAPSQGLFLWNIEY